MAVYTKTSPAEMEKHLEKYNLGKLINIKEIIDGIDNSNFLLATEKGQFIFTIFESRINKDSLDFFVKFKLHLAQKGIFCPHPILDNKGSAIVDIKDKKSVIVTFLNGTTLKPRSDGYYENITPHHCFEVGKIMAQMHLAAQDFVMSRPNDLGIKDWKFLFAKFESKLPSDLWKEISQNLDFLQKSWNFDLPSCTSHLDLFPDNVFFNEAKNVSGVIDFYFAANEAMIYDFAIVVNAWCFDAENNFEEQRFDEILRGYESIRKFSQQEKNFLKVALIGAAMRFLLTRLHDSFFTPEGSLVNIKNPQEYLAKLRFFKSQL